MKVSTEMVRDTLKRLPVGYYIGREVKVVPEDDIQTSYYDMLNDTIHIDTRTIVDTVSRLTDDATLEDIEYDVRCMLYHELSHAMLTPRSLKPTFAVNVVEDVRIEGVLKGYYLNTDFEEFNQRYISATPNDCAANGFIRFCKIGEEATPELRAELNEILRKYRRLDARSDDYNVYGYDRDIKYLYDHYKEWWNDNHDQDQSQDQGDEDQDTQGMSNPSNESSGEGTGAGSGSGQPSGGESGEDAGTPCNGQVPTSGHKDSEGDEISSTDTLSHGQSFGKEIREKLQQITEEYRNEYLMTEFDRILRNFKKVTSARSSAVNTYSGVLDPRSAGREDYRLFLQHNTNGNARGFSKIHLNLFLDESGSFCSSEHIAREIIYTLCWLEKQIPNFDFTLIRCGDGETIADKNDMKYSAHTGTAIGADVFNTFKKVQRRDAENYNILLYDGRAYSNWVGEGHDGYIGNFAAYNTSNTLIITDPENKDAVETYCPSARKVISKNYTDELIKNLVKMTEILLK